MGLCGRPSREFLGRRHRSTDLDRKITAIKTKNLNTVQLYGASYWTPTTKTNRTHVCAFAASK
nr:MAG TPA: hypothetical protein [Caudoviricetes sp.]